MKLLVVLAVSLTSLFGTSGSVEQLANNPDDYIATAGVFNKGIAVCTRPDPAGLSIIQIVTAYVPSNPSEKHPKMMVVRAHVDDVKDANIKPGAIFTVEGRVNGNLRTFKKFWIDADSLTRTGTSVEWAKKDLECDKVADEALHREDRKWIAAGIVGTILGGAAGYAVANIPTKNSEHFSP